MFPDAIGGKLVLSCVCKSCNDQIGSYVDSQLTENFLVRMLRMSLCIENKGGVVPSPLHDGTIKDHPERRGSFHPNGDGTGQVTLRPLVERTRENDGRERVKIVAAPHEAEEILRKIQERAARDGCNIRVIEKSQSIIGKPVVIKEVKAGPTNLIRALLKIAYELGVYWLGPTYASHVSGLSIARAVVTGVFADVEATLGYFPPRSAFVDWEIPSWYHAAHLEVADGGIWIALRVFNVVEARVLLVDHSQDFPQVGSRWVHLDPLSGSVVEGSGPKPPAVAADEGTRISWSATGQDRFRVTVVYRGQEATNTDMELERP